MTRRAGELSAGTGDMAEGTGGDLGLPAALIGLPPVGPEFAGLTARLGYGFRRLELLRAALTAPSSVNEPQSAGWPSNGCLEFLGDAVLDLVAADTLWRRFPALGEGALTRLRASLVSEASLAAAAREIGLGEFLVVGRSETAGGKELRDGSLADAVEAVLAAAFLDARAAGEDPLAAAGAVFEALLGARVAVMSPADGVDAKSRLQLLMQARHRRAPAYQPVSGRPAEHEGLWRVQATLTLPEGQVLVLGEGAGVSLRAAEQEAARVALLALEA